LDLEWPPLWPTIQSFLVRDVQLISQTRLPMVITLVANTTAPWATAIGLCNRSNPKATPLQRYDNQLPILPVSQISFFSFKGTLDVLRKPNSIISTETTSASLRNTGSMLLQQYLKTCFRIHNLHTDNLSMTRGYHM
jgi:hypothetical protein